MGTDETSAFDATADYDQTLLDYYQEVFDIWVADPFKILWDDYRGRFGLSILFLYLLAGTVGTVVVPEPSVNQADRLLQPFQDPNHLLGSDGLGQDLLALMVHATPAMFKMMFSGVLFGSVSGVTLGMIAGYKGGVVDKVIMTYADVLASLPGIPLLIIITAILQPTNPYVIGMIVNIQGMAGIARGMRSQVLPLVQKEHIEAAVAQGQPLSSIMVKEILPNLLPLIFIGLLGGAVGIVNASVGLYFLGILPFSTRNWGVTLNYAFERAGALYSADVAHWLLVPLLTITLLNLGLTLLAQAFDQVFNPRVRARHRGRKAKAAAERGEATDHDTDAMDGQLQT